jgi:uncharacterized protein (DUF58 family)
VSVTTHPLAIRIADWIARREGVEHGDVLLDRKRVYILPTRAGLIFGAAMIVLLIGSINYGLQLGFLLTFLVTSIAVVGMYHTHRNLARVLLRGHRAEPVFAGDVATFELLVINPTPEARHALNFSFVLPTRRKAGGLFRRERPMPGSWADVPAGGSRSVELSLPTRRRGRRACPRVRIETRFPFGLWQAWAYFTPPISAIVYPKPEEDAPPLPLALGGSLYGAGVAASGEDFAGVRPYQDGDSQRMIAWKLAARSDELSVKLFEAAAGGELTLDFDALPPHLGVEGRLARLARWVLDADAAQLRYALRLPGVAVDLASGAEQRERCLTALALYKG